MRYFTEITAMLGLVVSGPVFNYVGPGAGLSSIGSFLVLFTLVVADFGFAWFPHKRMLNIDKNTEEDIQKSGLLEGASK